MCVYMDSDPIEIQGHQIDILIKSVSIVCKSVDSTLFLISSALIRLLTVHVAEPMEKQSSALTDTCRRFKAAGHLIRNVFRLQFLKSPPSRARESNSHPLRSETTACAYFCSRRTQKWMCRKSFSCRVFKCASAWA